MDVRPFLVSIPEAALEDLRRRLARVRWPDAIEEGWRLGAPPGYLRELVEEWRTRFDWRRTEARIRGFPNFTAEISGLRVHFLHARGSGLAPFRFS